MSRLPPRDELKEAPEEEPCMGLWAVAGLYDLGLDDEQARNWPKLAGRPAGRVRALLTKLREEKPELIQTRLTEFAKNCESKGRTLEHEPGTRR